MRVLQFFRKNTDHPLNQIRKFVTICGCVTLFAVTNCFAQGTMNIPDNSLKAAYSEFELGHFDKCVTYIQDHFTDIDKNSKFEAYRLMALCYLNMNKEKEAEDATVKLLNNNHLYLQFPYYDPVELSQILSKYEMMPLWEGGIKIGMNTSTVSPINNYSMTGSPSTFIPNVGYQLGVGAEYHLNQKISLTGDLLFTGLNYSRVDENVSGWKQTYSENLQYFSVPLVVRYYFFNSRTISLASDIGLLTQFFNTSFSNLLFENAATGRSVQRTYDPSLVRNKMLLSPVIGIAFKYKLGNGNITADLRMSYGLTNIIKASERYSNLDFNVNNQYVDSDISLNVCYLTFGYEIPLSYAVVKKLH